MNDMVGIVIVSHSIKIAEGAARAPSADGPKNIPTAHLDEPIRAVEPPGRDDGRDRPLLIAVDGPVDRVRIERPEVRGDQRIL